MAPSLALGGMMVPKKDQMHKLLGWSTTICSSQDCPGRRFRNHCGYKVQQPACQQMEGH